MDAVPDSVTDAKPDPVTNAGAHAADTGAHASAHDFTDGSSNPVAQQCTD